MLLLVQAGYACQWPWDYRLYSKKELPSEEQCLLVAIQQVGLLLGPWLLHLVTPVRAATAKVLVVSCLVLSAATPVAKTRGFFVEAAVFQGVLPSVAVALLNLGGQMQVAELWQVLCNPGSVSAS